MSWSAYGLSLFMLHFYLVITLYLPCFIFTKGLLQIYFYITSILLFLALSTVFPFFKDPKLILHCTNHTIPRMSFISIMCKFPGDKECLLEVSVQVVWWRARRLRSPLVFLLLHYLWQQRTVWLSTFSFSRWVPVLIFKWTKFRDIRKCLFWIKWRELDIFLSQPLKSVHFGI